MIRATITITGDVQGAGYRTYIIMVARKLGLEGYTENLPNGVINVVCEGKKEKIGEFVSKIKIKNEVVEVEDTKIKYDKLTGEFKGKGFVIKVEESFKGLIQEMFHGYATSEKYFRVGWGKQDKMLEKQDKMLDKQDETTAAIKGLDKKQDVMIKKQDVMIEKQDKMIGKQDIMIEKQDKMIGKQDKTIEVIGTRFDTMDSKYGDISETMKEMKNLFEKLVDYIIKKEK